MARKARDPQAGERGERDRDERTGPDAGRVRLVRSKFAEIVLVCAKCAKRQGLKDSALRRDLKRELKGRGRAPGGGDRKPRVLAVGCLGPCPKTTLAIATLGSLARQRIHLVEPDASPARILDLLFPGTGPETPDPGDALP